MGLHDGGGFRQMVRSTVGCAREFCRPFVAHAPLLLMLWSRARMTILKPLNALAAVCACLCARARVCLSVCVRARARACVCVCA